MQLIIVLVALTDGTKEDKGHIMNYIINYTKEGKILGFVKCDSDLNIEVTNAIWFEAQRYNKIMIDNEIISFDTVDWITPEEIEAQKIAQLNINAINTLNSTDWKVIRELERLMLSGTELNLEREALRKSVI